MKKFFKIFGITLGSLVGLVLVVLCIALWLVFTPERFTPIVRSQVEKYVPCPTHIGRVELTFFSSFPRFELQIDQVAALNPQAQAECGDTLVRADRLQAAVDVKAFLKHRELRLSGIRLLDGQVCAYVDGAGRANFDLFPPSPDEPEADDGGGLPFGLIDVSTIELRNIDLSYIDRQSGMEATVRGLCAVADASLRPMDSLTVHLATEPFAVAYADSSLTAEVRGLAPDLSVALQGNRVQAGLHIQPQAVSLAYAGDAYLTDAEVGLDLQAVADLARLSAQVEQLALSFNGLSLGIQGKASLDTVRGEVHTDLTYRLDLPQVQRLLASVPAAFHEYVDGIEAAGSLTAQGTVQGVYNDSTMPAVTAQVQLDGVSAACPDLLPFPLKQVDGNLAAYVDLQRDDTTFLQIDRLAVRTPQSRIALSGRADRLLTDPHADLTADANLHLPELAPFVPDSMNVTMAGTLKARVAARASLSQVEQMALEQIKASASLQFKDLAVAYDTLSLKTNDTRITLSLPNPNARTKHTGFAAAGIEADQLDVALGTGMQAALQGLNLDVETSDVRDTTRIPAVNLRLGLGFAQAGMDSMSVQIEQPEVAVSVAPQRRNAGQPRFSVKVGSGKLNADLGTDRVQADLLDVAATVFYNKNQEDIFLRWMPRGAFHLQQGVAHLAALPYPVELPQVKMDFTPRTFEIEQAGVHLGASDFNLAGKLDNILPFFRGDSILRGDFAFTSAHTDIDQLMALTSGLGSEEETAEDDATEALAAPPAAEETPADTAAYTGPYMVPQGIDLTLHTDIAEASFNQNLITDVDGDVRVANGTLALEELTFTTPGSDIQLTAMYQTPRRNHLFVGLDFHMMKVEIADLLHMIPDLDSIMPMLRSFDGTGEFHLAAETNLDSLYNLKMSTLRGAASIRGEELKLVDGETFAEIARMLRFKNRQKENQVDSLTAEFTVFRNEIDVYPFLIAIDRYKAVVGGRHNLDMSFDYNISLVESPLPFRASVEVSGNLDDMKFRLARAKYPDFYRPAARYEVKNKQQELRDLIKRSLVANVANKEE